MLKQLIFADSIIKIPGIERINRDSKLVSHRIQIHTAHIERFVADDLRRTEFINLIHQTAAVRKFCDKIISGRNICDCNSIAVCNIDDTHDVIILRFI